MLRNNYQNVAPPYEAHRVVLRHSLATDNPYKAQVKGGRMPIKAVLFDLGDTLIGNSLTAFETFQKILEKNSIRVTTRNVEEAFVTAKKELEPPFEQLIGKIPLLEFYQLWDSLVLKALKVEDDGFLAKQIYEHWFNVCGITLFPDVTPALTMLRKKKIKTGIISNAYEEEIYQILAEVDLSGFDIVVGSDTVRKAKPDPEVFLYAVKKLSIPPKEAVYVGNDIEKDYKGAEKAGMNPLLIVRENADVSDVKYIKSLAGLAEYMECTITGTK